MIDELGTDTKARMRDLVAEVESALVSRIEAKDNVIKAMQAYEDCAAVYAIVLNEMLRFADVHPEMAGVGFFGFGRSAGLSRVKPACRAFLRSAARIRT